VTSRINRRTFAERAQPAQLLARVWAQDGGLKIPGVLLDWDRRDGSWWGLVVLNPGTGQERVWLPAGPLQAIETP
jgi:hypothetical protein